MNTTFEDALLERCRKTLAEYHADVLSVIAAEGIKGANYDDVWLEINLRLGAELDDKRKKGKTDGALYAVGEFLQRVEDIQGSLSEGDMAMALLSSLWLAREANELRGKMILRQTNLDHRESARAERPSSVLKNPARIVLRY